MPASSTSAKESDDQLIERLHSPNVYFRDLAQRLLCERDSADVRAKLEQLVLDDAAPRKARMHALWSLVGTGSLNSGVSRASAGPQGRRLPRLGRAGGGQLRQG